MGDIEFDAFLADSVASVQGKLYALGAGWNRIAVALFPARHDRVGIGLLVRIPAGSAVEARRFELRLLGPSGEDLSLGAGPEGPVNRIGGRVHGRRRRRADRADRPEPERAPAPHAGRLPRRDLDAGAGREDAPVHRPGARRAAAAGTAVVHDRDGRLPLTVRAGEDDHLRGVARCGRLERLLEPVQREPMRDDRGDVDPSPWKASVVVCCQVRNIWRPVIPRIRASLKIT